MPRTDKMFDFIKQELVEARLFRFPENLHGRDAQGLARLLFASLLTMEIMRYESTSRSVQYAQQSLIFNEFDHMRNGATDLANLIAVLSNQSKYEKEIDVNPGISAPVLQIRTFLRTFASSSYDQSSIRQFFIKLDDMLSIAGGEMHQARRIISDWEDASQMEKYTAWSTLNRVFNSHGTQLDIYILAKQYLDF